MASTARLHRQKLSTTIALHTMEYLEDLISSGAATTLAEAIDLVVERLHKFESRERLESDTAAYFDQMSGEELAEENRLGSVLTASGRGLDVNREP